MMIEALGLSVFWTLRFALWDYSSNVDPFQGSHTHSVRPA